MDLLFNEEQKFIDFLSKAIIKIPDFFPFIALIRFYVAEIFRSHDYNETKL